MKEYLTYISPRIVIGLALVLIVNWISGIAYKRFDLTQDQRYTLSESTVLQLQSIEAPLYIDVLLEGNFPSEFKRLQLETLQLLEEYRAINKNIHFNFVNPLEDEAQPDEVIKNLFQMGLTPANVTVTEGTKTSEEVVFPWAIANYGERSVKVPLLKNKLGADSDQRILNSVQHLEYAFTDAIAKLLINEKQKIAVLKGNGQLEDIYIADFITQLRDYYHIAPFTIASVATNPIKTAQQLNEFDLLLVAKPTQRFTDQEKQILDQFTMHGGKSLWLLDQVTIEMDSLYNQSGKTIAFPNDLNTNDMFFRYGIRMNPNLVNDLYCTQIVMAMGDGSQSQYNPVPWRYYPLVTPIEGHPITNNLDYLWLRFANSIDLLDNDIKKTVLFTSSPLSKTEGTPEEISLNSIYQQPDRESYKNGNLPLAVLLEGSFTSVFKNRVKPVQLPQIKEESIPTKMIVIADGDLIKNQVSQGRPLELGYDKWTNNFYGNKEFLRNCVNYLLDENGLINIRTKEIQLAFLDKEKVNTEKNHWKALNIGLPLVLLLLFGIVFSFIRRKKYVL